MTGPNTNIVVVDLRIPFTRLVLFFFKALFAILLAGAAVSAILMVASAVVASLLGSDFDMLMKRATP